MVVRLYTDLAEWWPLLSPPTDYADEAAALRRLIVDAGIALPGRLLELGSGGGHLAHHLAPHFDLTLVDASVEMLAVSRRLNPDARHLAGDMRTVRLGETFDVVLIGDAIMHMVTDADLAAAMATAAAHCRAGGLLVVCPDRTEESFGDATSSGGSDAADGRGLRYLEWCHRPPGSRSCLCEMAYLLRQPDGTVTVAHDRFPLGLFSVADWRGALKTAGFDGIRPVTLSDRTIFLARPAG